MSNTTLIHEMLRNLYPEDARAFKVPYGSDLWRLLRAEAQGYGRIADAADNVLDALIPDNDNFSEDDAADWERRLGLAVDPSIDLADRKKAIMRKMAHPGRQPARQHYIYIQEQLRSAGFDVYLYENKFDDGMGGYETRSPADILGVETANAVLDMIDLDEAELDASWSDEGITIIANKITAEGDEDFDIGTNLRPTFFVAGATVDTFADVPAERETELRELILKLKPVQCIGFLFVNFS